MNNEGLFDRVVAGLRWITASRFLVQVSSWAFTLIVIRLISPQDYGLLAMSGAVLGMFTTVVDCGFGPALTTRRDVDDVTRRSVLGAVLAMATVAFLIIFGTAPFAARFFDEPRLELVLRIAALQLYIVALAVVPKAKLSRELMFREQAISFTIAGVVQSIATIALALNGFAYWSLLFGTLAGAIIDLMLVTYFSKVLLMPSWRLDPLRPIFAFSRFTLGERLLWYLVQNTDTVAIGRLSSTHELGVFSIAKQLSHLPLDKIGDISSTLTVAGFSRIQHDNVALVRAVQRLVLIGSTIGFPLFWGLLIVSPAAVPIVLGKNWIEATPVIQAFCVALPLRAIWTLLTRALVGMGRPDVSFQNQALWLLIVLPAIVVGSTFGSTEVAAAWSISFPILFLISSFRIAKVLESSVKSVLAPMLTPAFAAGLMIAVTAAQSHLMRDHDPLSFLLLALPSAVLTFVIAVRVTSKDVYTELTSLIKSLAGVRQQ